MTTKKQNRNMETQLTAALPAASPANEAAIALQQAEAQFALSPIGQMAKQFEVVQKMAQIYADSTIVPDTYKSAVAKYDKATKQWSTVPNPSGLANCAIAIDMAIRMGMPPVMVMQNLYIVNGNPAWSAKFLIGCIQTCGRFQDLEYEVRSTKGPKGDDFAMRCVSYAKSDTARKKPLKGTWITWQMVRAEGWDNKTGSKWATMPEQMFRYRAAAFWQRAYAPEIALGLMTQEEAEDMRPAVVDVAASEVAPAEPAEAAIDPKRREGAMIQLYKTLDADSVKSVRDTFIDIYEADPSFRQEVVDRMNFFASQKPQAQQQQPETPGNDEQQ